MKIVVFWVLTLCVLVAASIFRAEDSKAGSSAMMVTSYRNIVYHTPEGSSLYCYTPFTRYTLLTSWYALDESVSCMSLWTCTCCSM